MRLLEIVINSYEKKTKIFSIRIINKFNKSGHRAPSCQSPVIFTKIFSGCQPGKHQTVPVNIIHNNILYIHIT